MYIIYNVDAACSWPWLLATGNELVALDIWASNWPCQERLRNTPRNNPADHAQMHDFEMQLGPPGTVPRTTETRNTSPQK